MVWRSTRSASTRATPVRSALASCRSLRRSASSSYLTAVKRGRLRAASLSWYAQHGLQPAGRNPTGRRAHLGPSRGIFRPRTGGVMATTETSTQTVPPLSILTENERDIAESVYQFAVETIGPKAAQMDRDNHIDPELVKQFFELDLMGIDIPEEFGGLGQNFGTAIAVIEALARVDASCAVVVDVQNTLVAYALLRWASPELKKKYLPQLAKSKVASYALSEAGSGSDAFALATTAAKEGGKGVLNGEKLWVTNGLE